MILFTKVSVLWSSAFNLATRDCWAILLSLRGLRQSTEVLKQHGKYTSSFCCLLKHSTAETPPQTSVRSQNELDSCCCCNVIVLVAIQFDQI